MAKPKRATDPNGVFAVRLRDCMEKQNISQSELAKGINKTRQAVSNYILGITVPDADTLVLISKQLRVSVDYLLGIPLTVRRNTVSEIQKTIINYVERYKDALIYLQNIEQLTHQLTAADTPTDDETADEYAGVNRDFSGGRYDGT